MRTHDDEIGALLLREVENLHVGFAKTDEFLDFAQLSNLVWNERPKAGLLILVQLLQVLWRFVGGRVALGVWWPFNNVRQRQFRACLLRDRHRVEQGLG